MRGRGPTSAILNGQQAPSRDKGAGRSLQPQSAEGECPTPIFRRGMSNANLLKVECQEYPGVVPPYGGPRSDPMPRRVEIEAPVIESRPND